MPVRTSLLCKNSRFKKPSSLCSFTHLYGSNMYPESYVQDFGYIIKVSDVFYYDVYCTKTRDVW